MVAYGTKVSNTRFMHTMKPLDRITDYVKILLVIEGPHRLVWSRTQAFQAWYMGSNPVGGTRTPLIERSPLFYGIMRVGTRIRSAS